jgi:hypothetical protein
MGLREGYCGPPPQGTPAAVAVGDGDAAADGCCGVVVAGGGGGGDGSGR